MAEIHEKAHTDYLAGMKYKDIASKYNVSLATVKSWKTRFAWDRKSMHTKQEKVCIQNPKSTHTKKPGLIGNKNAVGHGAPKGNKNSVGHTGGGPIGNKKAVTTGEYETIWMDCLTDKEQELCSRINTDHRAQVEEEITLLTLRERRMMERIMKLFNELPENQRKVLQERITTSDLVTVKDPFTDKDQTIWVKTPKLVTTSIEETTCRKIDDILRIEEALTRVQDKKGKLLALKHELCAGDPPAVEDDGFIDALKAAAGGVWNGETAE